MYHRHNNDDHRSHYEPRCWLLSFIVINHAFALVLVIFPVLFLSNVICHQTDHYRLTVHFREYNVDENKSTHHYNNTDT